jgi:hypothetical protein
MWKCEWEWGMGKDGFRVAIPISHSAFYHPSSFVIPMMSLYTFTRPAL